MQYHLYWEDCIQSLKNEEKERLQDCKTNEQVRDITRMYSSFINKALYVCPKIMQKLKCNECPYE